METDNFALRRDIARGQAAQRVLEDPVFVDAMETTKAALRDAFFDTSTDARELRETLHLMDRARQQFEAVFEAHLRGMEVARAELAMRENVDARLQAVRRRQA